MLETETIINMGFLLHNLHNQIFELQQKQFGEYHAKPFYVYRGQGLLKTDFEKLVAAKGGLLFFNNFLSTSNDTDVSAILAESISVDTSKVAILFKMFIDPSVSSTPFASIKGYTYFKEEEILFSMHTVFRVGEIIQIDTDKPFYHVELTLTSDDDQELQTLTKCIQKETADSTGWKRLGHLLLKIGQYDKAEQLYKTLEVETLDENEKSRYYNQLGTIRNHQSDYQKATLDRAHRVT
ncbi:unnamed protein product [Didymodactylos carnosus]|uniref:Tetratricopeptide repeat protein n=1 Tax=Didymodactylos carnosus TaxID=1234261 RepID=A0A815XB28_9BILA|nr:unnamed protein product [Didymodactylos carnosus]CAF1555326.1 unnamed protein product [Didymodactylos carnosus]CAF4190757.1 unnamed protein product [Didymodactylos carnosus]CAF4416413.1 unnamed protein product [Didymodactylos carnosus]